MVKIHLILTGASGYLGQHLLTHWLRKDSFTRTIPSRKTPDGHEEITSVRVTALYNRSEKFPEAFNSFLSSKTASSGSDDDNDEAKPTSVEISVEKLDLCDGQQIDTWIKKLFSQKVHIDVNKKTKCDSHVIVVHAAALANPRLCQQDPEMARNINVPKAFFDAINSLDPDVAPTVTMIALSTDQVYDGKQHQPDNDQSEVMYYKENEKDALKPVNVYGESKLEMEEYLKITWTTNDTSTTSKRTLYLLRSSIILGPKAPIDPESTHDTFLHFVESRGKSQQPTSFYTNEHRTVISVRKVISVIDDLIVASLAFTPEGTETDPDADACKLPVVWNMGGSVRVNRFDMAVAVFDHFGYDHKLLESSLQTAPNVPLDISMDSSQMKKYGIGSRFGDEKLKDLVELTFHSMISS
jgi:dTDP-4-dehydrorhamnose reductase